MANAATVLIGVLVSFLVMGIIGVFVCSEIIAQAEVNSTDPLYESQMSIIETFQMGINLSKLVVLVSAIGLIFALLQRAGLIPSFNQQGGGEV